MMTMGVGMIPDSGEGRLKFRKYLIFRSFRPLISFDEAMRDNNQRCGKSSPTMAKRAMRPNVQINLLGFIISQRDDGE